MLANIGACISDDKQTEILSDSRKQDIVARLVQWHDIHAAGASKQESDTFALSVLCHSCFIRFCDIDLLGRISSQNGKPVSEANLEIARQWAVSTDGVRCLTHSHLLQGHVENMRMNLDATNSCSS
jgi:delta-aminolevulinic acid dehydratase/porphobilinogen synthase